eukprot:scaffold79656_cov60-Phaeocystis_antarctica.AAC.7
MTPSPARHPWLVASPQAAAAPRAAALRRAPPPSRASTPGPPSRAPTLVAIAAARCSQQVPSRGWRRCAAHSTARAARRSPWRGTALPDGTRVGRPAGRRAIASPRVRRLFPSCLAVAAAWFGTTGSPSAKFAGGVNIGRSVA